MFIMFKVARFAYYTIITIVLTPVIMPLFLVCGIIQDYPKCCAYYQYKINSDVRYLKYEELPYFVQQNINYTNYNSYKDKIATIQNNTMVFAYKHIDTQTNKIVYITKNNEAIDTDIEQYKIARLEC